MSHDQPFTYDQAIRTLRLGINCADLEVADAVEAEVGRLRETLTDCDGKLGKKPCQYGRCMTHVTDQAEIERLNDRIKKWVAENNLLRADVERLLGDKGWYRDQLDRIANTNHGCESCHAKAEIARAAIAVTEKTNAD